MHTKSYTYVYINTHMYIYIHTYTHTYIYIYIHIYTHIYIYIHISLYIHTYVRTYIHTHTHIYIYMTCIEIPSAQCRRSWTWRLIWRRRPCTTAARAIGHWPSPVVKDAWTLRTVRTGGDRADGEIWQVCNHRWLDVSWCLGWFHSHLSFWAPYSLEAWVGIGDTRIWGFDSKNMGII